MKKKTTNASRVAPLKAGADRQDLPQSGNGVAVTDAERTEMPRSTAKTAYDLLSDVKRVIREEPLRYNQSIWLATPALDREWSAAMRRTGDLAPACETIGCVAGWVAALKGDRGLLYAQTAQCIAKRRLGLTAPQAEELFGDTLDDHAFIAGTPEYAELGVKHITRFQRKYARRLKAKRIR